jgi:hypothetical protein
MSIAFGHQVYIMKAEVFNAQLAHQLKACVHLRARMRHGGGLFAKGLVRRAGAEHIRARRHQRVPPRHGKGQMLAHGLAQHDAVGVIVPERQRVFGLGPLECYLGDVGKNLSHGCLLHIIDGLLHTPRHSVQRVLSCMCFIVKGLCRRVNAGIQMKLQLANIAGCRLRAGLCYDDTRGERIEGQNSRCRG